MKKFLLGILFALAAVSLGAQQPTDSNAAYIWSGAAWEAAPSTGTAGALPVGVSPPAKAMYCWNSSLSQWVKADSSCFGGSSGSGTVSEAGAGQVAFYGAAGTTVGGATGFLTNGSHQAMGSAATIDGVPTLFWGSASAILNAQEVSTTATGSNGIYIDESWAPASTVTPGGTGVFGIGANVTINLDGQATADTYSAAGVFSLTDSSNTTGVGQEYSTYITFNKTGTSTDGEIATLDVEGTMTTGVESDHITNTLNHFSFSGGTATGSGVGNSLYDATLSISGGTPGSWAFYRVNVGDTQLTAGTIQDLTNFQAGGTFGNGATITNIVGFNALATSGGSNVTGLYIGQMTGTSTSYQIDSEGTALSLFKGNIQAPMYQETLTTPASSSAACIAGQFTDDASYHYVCTATSTWKRVALTTF